MRLNLEDPKVWDRWRDLYYVLTHDENIEFGNAIEAKYHNQNSYTVSNFDHLFKNCAKPFSRVLEIGGWKGELAQHCLSKYTIISWLNVDMCKAAVDKSVCKDLRYLARFPNRFDWFEEKRSDKFDICISAHAIEHLSDQHLEQLIKYISGIPLVIFEAPISMERNDWSGYQGTHILKYGWNDVNRVMAEHGYQFEKLNDFCFVYRKNV